MSEMSGEFSKVIGWVHHPKIRVLIMFNMIISSKIWV